MRQRFASLFAIAWIASSNAAGSQPEWKPIPTGEDGIRIFQRQDAASDVISVRGEAEIPARLQDVIRVMADNSQAPEWMPFVAEKRDVRMVAANERIEFVRVDMPWPVTDRYFVNRGRVESLPNGGLKVVVESVDESYPTADAGLIRGIIHFSTFILEPAAEGAATQMTLEVNSDPRGWIPTVFVNAAQREWPRMFFGGLTKQLKKLGLLNESRATTVAH